LPGHFNPAQRQPRCRVVRGDAPGFGWVGDEPTEERMHVVKQSGTVLGQRVGIVLPVGEVEGHHATSVP
jgi:hypothetical protein